MSDTNESSPNDRILVVDDEPMVGRVFERLLKRDYDVVTVSSGGDALSYLQEHEVDCVLSDLMMPEMSGMEFYERIERDFPEYTERFAFLSGGVFSDDADSFLREHDIVVIEKPFSPESVKRIVNDLV